MTRFATVSQGLLDAVGTTPLVELRRSFEAFDGRVLAKLDFLTPSRTGRDRVAARVLRDARKDGRLLHHGTVVGDPLGEGNASLAMACAALGHPFVAVEAGPIPAAQRAALESLGAEIVEVEADGDRTRRHEVARERAAAIASDRGAFHADLLSDLGAFRAHRLGTGPEILSQTGGEIDVFCDLAGTGATFAGCAAAFKEFRGGVQCYLAEPASAPALARGEDMPVEHGFLGAGLGRATLPLLDRGKVDGFLAIDEGEAREATAELALREGLRVDLRSGANLAAARQILNGPRPMATIVIVLGSGAGG